MWEQPVINPYRVKEIPPVLRADIYFKNIFSGGIFSRELEDLKSELPEEKQKMYGQKHRVEKLTLEEIIEVQKRNK